jgi:DNA-binding NtrC family response regulator
MEKKKILIVEDEFIVANDLRLTLEREGYVVEGIASSFKEASQMIDQTTPDLALLDIHIKGKQTGIDVAGLLQKRKIAFVYLSANSDQRILESAKATEPYGFLVKPFRLKDLLVTLDIAFYRHEHTLESELRNRKQLEKQLELIASIHKNETEKLLQIALAIQLHIPFDYISVFRNVAGESTHSDYSLLRTGFEEYQEIGTNQLAIITGLKENELKTIRAASPFEEKAGLYNKEEFITVCRNNPLKRLLAKNFNLESNLDISLSGSAGISYSMCLFSHKSDIYFPGHLSLMQSLQGLLLKILDSCSLPVSSTAAKSEKSNAGVKEVSPEPVFKGIIGSSPQLLNVLDLIRQVASLNTSVLVTGESGTGKEKIADCIHHLSDRKNKSFVKINCAALPPTLIESELFGHEKGSFTGALDKKIGKFEQADGGTIFLDEIGEMPVDMQVKLLRVLQEREFERIGGKSTIKIDVRIIAATNRNLEKEVAEGKFRLDLYFRINVFPIHLPPLRERQQDVKEISEYLAKQISIRMNREYHGISSAMMDALQAYSWPGNIRELENTIEQNVIMNDGKSPLVLKRPLLNIAREGDKKNEKPGGDAEVRTMTDLRKLQHNTERDHILSALKKSNGRVRGAGGAAERLNLKPTTLESRIAKLGIRKEEYSNNFGG